MKKLVFVHGPNGVGKSTACSLLHRRLSASYAPRERDPNYQEFIGEPTEVFRQHSVMGVITMPNATRSYIWDSTDLFGLVEDEERLHRISSDTGIDEAHIWLLCCLLWFHRFRPSSLSRLEGGAAPAISALRELHITNTG